jgi:hypothetical protein
MDDVQRKNAKNTRGRPFESGNPGRPRGSLSKATLIAQAVLDGEAGTIARKAVELALAGDLQALKLCMDRLLPSRRERTVRFELPPITSATSAGEAAAALLGATSRGELTPGEANSMLQLVEGYCSAIAVSDFELRLSKLEEEKR